MLVLREIGKCFVLEGAVWVVRAISGATSDLRAGCGRPPCPLFISPSLVGVASLVSF
jgi:hypothetical protein